MTRILILGLVLTTLAFSTAVAATPDPGLSNCPAIMTITPDGSYTYTVDVVGQLGPISGSFVEIQVSPAADAIICWCVGQVHPSITAVSDSTGEASFTVAGGGCVTQSALGSVVATIFADGIQLCEIEINSPDVTNANGFLPTDAGYVGDANCSVGLADAVFHTASIAWAAFEPCTKFFEPYNGSVVLVDAVFLTPYISNGTSCVAQ